ncbi:hypothetical protein [Streptomyces sp. YIM 121038]|uniref:hypothetical protein n=1 Tax=Streptomyces sp. YIM 121038 TaxID=2136401 RepID=UPI0031FE5C13
MAEHDHVELPGRQAAHGGEEADVAVQPGELMSELLQPLRYDDPAQDRPHLLLEVALPQQALPVGQDLQEGPVHRVLGSRVAAQARGGVPVKRLLVGQVERFELQRQRQHGRDDWAAVVLRVGIFGHESSSLRRQAKGERQRLSRRPLMTATQPRRTDEHACVRNEKSHSDHGPQQPVMTHPSVAECDPPVYGALTGRVYTS